MDSSRRTHIIYTLSTLYNTHTHIQPMYQEDEAQEKFSDKILSNQPRGEPRDELRSLHLCPLTII